MTNEDYLRKLAFRFRHRVESLQTRKTVRAWILFLEAEMESDYYAFKLNWQWMVK